MTGFKHFFSSFVGLRVAEKNLSMKRTHSKFINWVLTFDFNTYILRANNFPSHKCKLCKTILSDTDFDNSSLLNSGKINLRAKKSHCLKTLVKLYVQRSGGETGSRIEIPRYKNQ